MNCSYFRATRQARRKKNSRLPNVCFAIFHRKHEGKHSIEKHLRTDKHKRAVSDKSAAKLDTFLAKRKPIDTKAAALEGLWTYHVIKSNSSFRSSECSSKILRTCFEIPYFHCARTKCEAIATGMCYV